MTDLYLEDGTRLSYQLQGQGPPLVLSNGLTTNTEFWKNVLPDWIRHHTVLTWDLPGHGRSSPARTPASARVEAQAEFVLRLMAACGMEHAVQVGWSTGCQVVLETCRRFPRACDALVLILGAAGHVLDTTRLPVHGAIIHKLVRFAPRPLFAALYRGLALCARLPFGQALARALGLVSPLAQRQDVGRVLAHLPSVDPGTLQTMLASLAEHEGADVLVHANVPTLIVAGDKDPFAPSELVGLPLHQAAPGTELLRLPEGTHTALLDHAEEIAQAVNRFAARAEAAAGAVPR